MRLTQDGARALMLAAQGLLDPPSRPATKPDVLDMIRRMGVLQIDTIHVVARSPYLVLWSRLGSYDPIWLDELLAEGSLFEYWSHEACFLPIEDYRLSRRLMLDGIGRLGWRSNPAWLAGHAEHIDRVLDEIRTRGPVRSADFTRNDGRAGTWWDWKPEKRALEYLHTAGALMIARRHNFQRLYDLRERVMPDWDDAGTPPLDEVWRALALKAVRALGVTTARWLPDYFRTPKRGAAALLASLVASGEIVAVEIEDQPEPAYVHRDNRALAEASASGTLRPRYTTLLSPFDPIVWDRARASALFGFDYRIECYTPAEKRRYGYFTLPILYNGALVGRLDPKAHRREGLFEVKALHLEPGIRADSDLVTGIAGALHRCAAWHGTPEVVVRRTEPASLAPRLTAALLKFGHDRPRITKSS